MVAPSKKVTSRSPAKKVTSRSSISHPHKAQSVKENARPKPNTAVPRNTGPALGETTNEDTSNVGKRSRKPSEKVAIQGEYFTLVPS